MVCATPDLLLNLLQLAASVEAAAQSQQAAMAAQEGNSLCWNQGQFKVELQTPRDGGETATPGRRGCEMLTVRKGSDPGWEQPQQVESVQ